MSTIQVAIDKASEIAKTYNPNNLAPFPFSNILNEFADLTINYIDKIPENVSGVFLLGKKNNTADPDHYYILINNKEPERRQYFTTAHEIGHYFLHKDVLSGEDGILIDNADTFELSHGLFRLTSEQKIKIEVEANNFAASLLMPEKLVREAWKTFGDVQDCADLFKVSLAAMSIRLEKLKLVDNK